MPSKSAPWVALSLLLAAAPAFAEPSPPPSGPDREISIANASLVPSSSLFSGVLYRHVGDSGFITTAGVLYGDLLTPTTGGLLVVPLTWTLNWPLYAGGALDTFSLAGPSGRDLAASLGVVGGLRLQIYQVAVNFEAHASILQLGQLRGVTERLSMAMVAMGWRF